MLDAPLGRYFGFVQPGGDPGTDPGHTGEIEWPWITLGFSQKSWKGWLGRGSSGRSCLGCCPQDLTPDEMDVWMYGWMNGIYILMTTDNMFLAN